MPSKKKARGKAPRRVTKSRKSKGDDGAVNGIDSEMQRLQINNNKSNDENDEEALLEAAITLAAAEKEEMKAAAKNDNGVMPGKCCHGLTPISENHVCEAFMKSFVDEYNACCGSSLRLDHIFRQVYEATKTKYAEVWIDRKKLQWVASFYLNSAVDLILKGKCLLTRHIAMFSSFFIQFTLASCDWDIFGALCNWSKLTELYDGDEHTLVSFCMKRIPCSCLDSKHKEVKSIPKIGICHNIGCSLPGQKAERSTMLSCTQCRKANYCSRKCQVAHWPLHRPDCERSARKAAH